ncbi:unnamed protein product, partial [Chrysoparadoxa australica]
RYTGNLSFREKPVPEWTGDDVVFWLESQPKLAAFVLAPAFMSREVNGTVLVSLQMSDLKDRKFHYPGFQGKVPMSLWVAIKRIQPKEAKVDLDCAAKDARFSANESIVDEATCSVLCKVEEFLGQGAFGEVYKVTWSGVGRDRGKVFAMKTVRFKDIPEEKRDEYRILLVEEVLNAVRVKPHPNIVNVLYAHIMGFCSEAEEYYCFEDFVLGKNLEQLLGGG